MFYDSIYFNDLVNFETVLNNCCCGFNFIKEQFDVEIEQQKNKLNLSGELKNVRMSKLVFELMLKFLHYENFLSFEVVESIVNFVKTGRFKAAFFDARVCLNHKNEVVLIKNFNQMFYLNSINRNAITFGVGPAGTGKTYLAVAQAVKSLKKGLFSRIVLTRPVLEAGESLGFLPGSLQSKIDPFLRPLYDAMCDFMGVDAFNKNLERGVVEVLPLAYMRGRSLNDSFIVLDEAQNTTFGQMKMFLTRLGFNSKMVIAGDLTQIDLPRNVESGLFSAIKFLKGVESIKIVEFNKVDVVRNSLVQQILEAYDNNK